VKDQDHLRLAADLDGAVERGEIVPWFQPQLDLASGVIVAVEALSRWEHPELGMVSPGIFIPLAEVSGAIHELGSFMIDEACRRVADWVRRDIGLELSVNVSADQLADENFYRHVANRIAELSIPPGRLTLEITESQAIANRGLASARLEALKALGLGVSIDDFGTGHSSVTQVLNLPATELKLDRSLVQDRGHTSGTLIAVTVQLAHERGMTVVAEGIETAGQLSLVSDLGCDRAQGYLIGRPAPIADIETLLQLT
jgi:EAL domain-containing protein (putative c-di-GMP-specific phosphodiesterase class I)